MVSRLSFGVLALSVVIVTGACDGQDGKEASPFSTQGRNADGSVAHVDPRLGVPSFVWLNRSGAPQMRASTTPEAVADAALPAITRAFMIDDHEMAKTVALDRVDASNTKGPIVATYEQRVGGLDVFRGGVRLMLNRDLETIAASGFLAPSARGADRPFAITASEALATAATKLSVVLSPSDMGEREGYALFASSGLLSPARVKRLLYPLKKASGFELEPAYYTEIISSNGPARAVIVSALDRRVLLDTDLVRNDTHTYRVFADPESKIPWDGPQGNTIAPHPTSTPDRMKLVFQAPASVTLDYFPHSQNKPWLPAGATTTAGNNVVSYADVAEGDGFGAGDIAPAVTAPKTFGNIYDATKSPNSSSAQMQAAAVQLFYVTNFLHDWFYDAGYDEKSGNHQTDNFGLGGKGNDPLKAEAQDFSGRNNANAIVPPDGSSPRIQMFVFSGATNASLEVKTPAPIAGVKTVGIANGFGKDVFDVTGSVVLGVDSGGADPSDGCEPLENQVTGKIVLVHRGTCSFAQKAQVAQEAGAIGCLIANVVSSVNAATAPFMGGTQAGITIPVLSLNLADGQTLESTPNATVQMKRAVSSDLDGALDTTIVAHEWGHVLSGRLVGNGLGLTTNQAGGLGEGWSDFVALLLSVRADDPGNFGGTYANGAYATSGSGDDVYFGTRRVPYSIDFKKNGLTLRHIQNGTVLPSDVRTSFGEDGSFNSEVHNTGEVWAAMLWECYAALLRDRPRLTFQEAQDRMKKYLVASLKLTPTDPTLLEARDAVLAAALAGDEADFKLFWQAFARRGAGAGALGPGKDSTTNQGVKESFESGNDLQIVETKLADDVITCDHDGILDEGEVGTIEVTIRNTGSGSLAEVKAALELSSPSVKLLDAEATKLPLLKPFETTKTKLKARVSGAKRAEPIEIDVTISDPSLPNARVVRVPLPTRFDADQAPDSSATDHVDTAKTSWRAAEPTLEGDGQKWARSTETGDGYWFVIDPALANDLRLTSAPFTLPDGATTFTLSFRHRYSFKRSTRRNVDLDGGVVEVSVDAGKTWTDISKFAAVDYNATIDTGGRNDNPLSGRKAYGSKSAGYPDQWVQSTIEADLGEHPEQVQLRFRVGAASTRVGADGWAIDDIELKGAANLPFWSYVPHADRCDPNGPSVNAGPAQVVGPKASVKLAGSATHPAGKPLTFLWTQIGGPAVVLKDAEGPTPSFDAPDATGVTMSFALRAHDGALLSAASKVDIKIESQKSEDEGCGCRTTPSRSRSAGLLAFGLVGGLLVRRLRRKRSTERL